MLACLIAHLLAHLVEARQHVPARQVLHLPPRLHEEAALGDAHHHPPAVAQPYEEPRVARAAVDGEEVEVVVEARQHRPLLTVP